MLVHGGTKLKENVRAKTQRRKDGFPFAPWRLCANLFWQKAKPLFPSE